MLGKVVDDRYQLVRLLGTGGMGNVYEAVHRGTGKHVAVKVIANTDLANDSGAVVRFQREAKAAASVETLHIVQILDAGTDRVTGIPYIAMELLKGDDVKELSDRLGPLDAHLALRIVAQACAGLQKAHDAGIVHRDIKPANLFVAHQLDGRVVVKVLDFGIAKLPSKLLFGGEAVSATTTGRLLGSPLFMSPEQVKGLRTLDHRTDVWSLGAVLYQALAGRPPFAECETVGELMVSICSQRPPPLDRVAPWVLPEATAIIDRALQIDPVERYPSAEAMLAAILPLLGGQIEIDANQLMSASGKRMPAPSSSDDQEPRTQSLDDSQRFLVEPPSSGHKLSLDPRPHPASGENNDSTMPSAQDEAQRRGSAISLGGDTQGWLPRPRRRPLLPALALLAAVALAGGAWLVGRADKPKAGIEPVTLEKPAVVTKPEVALPQDGPRANELPRNDPPATKIKAGTLEPTGAAGNPTIATREPRRKSAVVTSANLASTAVPPASASAAPPILPAIGAGQAATDPTPAIGASVEPQGPASPWMLDRKFPVKKSP